MFDSYTDRARLIISNANDEAEKAGSPSIEVDHLVAALCGWKESVAIDMLGKLGADPKALLVAARKRMPTGYKRARREILQFTDAAKQVLTDAAAEMKSLQMDYTGTEHLLLAILARYEGQPDAPIPFGRQSAVKALMEIIEDSPIAIQSQRENAAVIELGQRLVAIGTILESSTIIDRTLLDRAFGALAGIDTDSMPAMLQHRVERLLLSVNEIAELFPDARDPSKPLPATALVLYAYRLQQIRRLAEDIDRLR